MKKIGLTLSLSFLISFLIVKSFAQAPPAIPYQAAARNSSGDVIANQSISLRFTIHDAATNGIIVYKEIQNVTTNALGLFSVNIGQGTPVTGTFSSIAWSVNSKFLQVEMDVNGGSNFIDMGTQQMMSVPYALYAATSGSSSGNLPNGNANGNTLRWNGSAWIPDSTLTNKGTNVGIGNPSPNASAALDITSTSKGFLMPRMTTAQRDAMISPAVGLQIFNTDNQCVDIYDGANWIETCGLKVTGSTTIPGTDSWTQKANFGGSARNGAVGFSIGYKGYLGTGFSGAARSDIWEYDPAADAWTQKADFGGGPRNAATGFSINGKGYVGMGSGSIINNDLYEYDPIANTWTQKASLPGPGRTNAVGFSIGGKGYIGTGSGSGSSLNDFYEYDPQTDTWTQKANVPSDRYYAVGFSIGNKGYLGGGQHFLSMLSDFYEYDPVTDLWTQKADIGGGPSQSGVGFSIGNKGYVGIGVTSFSTYHRFWQYDPTTNSWTQKDDFPGSAQRQFAVGFSIGTKGYIGTGFTGNNENDFWEYSPDAIVNTYNNLSPVSASTVNNGTWTQSNAAIYNSNSGNVGIGTSTPSQKLEVSGTTKTTNLQMTNGAAAGKILQSDASGNANWTNLSGIESDPKIGTLTTNKIPRWNTSSLTDGTISDNGTNVGIGTSSPSQRLDVAGTTKTTNFQMTNGASAGKVLQSDATGNASWTNLSGIESDPKIGTLTTNKIPRWNTSSLADGTITDNGTNVGIGTTSPNQKLDVAGTTRTTNFQMTNGAAAGKFLQSDASGNASWATATLTESDPKVGTLTSNTIPRWNTTSLADGIITDNGINVGIGTSSPNQKLDVAGTTRTTNFQMTNGAAAGKFLQSDASGNASWANATLTESDPKVGTLTSNTIPRWNSTSLADGIITDDGTNIGIGTASPTQKLDVIGTTRTTNFQMTSGATAGRVLQSDASGNASWGTESDPKIGIQVFNTIPKWSGNFLTPSMIYENGSQVGIATITPRGRFDVSGPGDIWLSFNGLNSGQQSIYLPGHIFIAPYDGSNISYLQARRSDNSGTTSLRIRTFNSGVITDAVQIEGNGNVGIGTTSPSQKLEVVGVIKTTAFQMPIGAGPGKFLQCDAAGNASWSFSSTTETDPKVGLLSFNRVPRWVGISLSDGSIYDNGTNVGIGTVSPSQKLEVVGTTKTINFQMTNGAAAGKVLQSDANGNASWATVAGIVESDPKVGTLTNNRIPKWNGSTLTDANISDNGFNVGINMPFGAPISSTFSVHGGVSIGNNYSFAIGAPVSGMVVEGKVAIGTINPTQMLEVGGTTKTSGLQVTTGAGTGKILQSDSAGNASWVASTSIAITENDPKVGSLTNNLVPKWNGSSLSNGVIFDDGTNIGIGTSTPSQKLEVSGTTKTTNFQMTNGGGAGKVLQSDASGNGSWINSTSIAITESDPKVGALTSNLIPKWNGSSLANGIVYDNGVKVGIGNTNPGTRFDVSGAIRTDSQLISTTATGIAPLKVTSTTKVTNLNADLLDGNDGSFYQNATNLTGIVNVSNGGTGTSTSFTAGSVLFAGASGVYSQNNANFFWDNTNSRLGLGTIVPGTKRAIKGGALSFHDNTNNVPYVGMDYDATSDALRLLANVGSSSLNNTYVTLKRLTGNLGIGTTSPQNKLDVEGSVAIGASYSGTNTAPTNGAIVEGNVGIGTNSPQNKLDVEGGVAIGSTYSGTSTAPTNGAIIEGNLGIGTVSPFSTIDVNGSVGMKAKTTLNAGTNNPDGSATVWIYTSGGGVVTLPSASSCPNRMYVLINYTISNTISTYINSQHISSTAFPTSLWLISDGSNWWQIK